MIVFLVAVSAFAAIQAPSFTSNQPFYVGVTYCGDSIAEAKQLIDEVKNYTNLFVLQSGSLLNNVNATKEIGDYAVDAGLKISIYYDGTFMAHELITMADQRWGNNFWGLYYKDEPGGKMIDKGYASFGLISRNGAGIVAFGENINDTSTRTHSFYPSGMIQVSEYTQPPQMQIRDNQTVIPAEGAIGTDVLADYYPNGTVVYSIHSEGKLTSGPYTYQPDGTVIDTEGRTVKDQGDISQFRSYSELVGLNPLGTNFKTADAYENGLSSELESVRSGQQSVISYQSALTPTQAPIPSDARILTSDYALYWFDYKGGYNTVLAEFVGNESRERHIALCRGAAETLGKDWGVMITWKYTQAPFLESADELYSDLSLAYSSGAQYIVVFNYENNTAHESLTEAHLAVMQKFWNTIHSDPDSLGKDLSRVAYVIPADYGFGFRSEADTIWGHFQADEQSAKIYNDVAALTAKYGASLNILYDGPETKARLGGYSAVYYYNQTVT